MSENQDQFNRKLEIAEAAVLLYEESGSRPGLFDTARAAGISVPVFYESFPNLPAVYHFWYESIPHRYRQMVAGLEGYEELILSEKLTNLMLTITDLMNEHRAFCKATFDEIVFRNERWHPFRKECENLIREIIKEHEGLSRTAQIVLWDDVYRFLSYEFLHIIKFWLRDTSENQEKTMVLMDHFNGLVGEMMTSRLIDRGTDLARFFWNEGLIKIPFINR